VQKRSKPNYPFRVTSTVTYGLQKACSFSISSAACVKIGSKNKLHYDVDIMSWDCYCFLKTKAWRAYKTVCCCKNRFLTSAFTSQPTDLTGWIP